MTPVDVHRWIETLGWTLLHSLWEALIIGLLFLWIRRILHSSSPSVKYALSTGALLLILLAAAGTFICLVPDTTTAVAGKNERTAMEWTVFFSASGSVDAADWLPAFVQWINEHLPALVTGWLIGMLLFGFRLVITWTYTLRMRTGVQPIVGFWENKLLELARDLNIRGNILLAESKRVDAPVLLGYLKPIILLPVGMISGLSPGQVETILLHELAHIRRHDFAINFIQSVIEVVFFFHPLVWIISSQIRSDRELCCDEMVVSTKSPLLYAQALHHLAAAQTLGNSFSLGIAGTKNKLLQRIHRIMKTSEKKEETRGKVTPAVMVIVALMGASWLSVQAYLPKRIIDPPVALLKYPLALPVDTVKKDLERPKSSRYSRESITTYDEKGEPHIEIIERSEADPEVGVLAIPPDNDLDLPVPEIPPFPEIPELEAHPTESSGQALNFDLFALDTLRHPGLWPEGPDRQEWEREFTEKFRQRFSDFYEKNRPEFDKMMKELDENLKKFHENFDQDLVMKFDSKREWKMREMEEEMRRLAPRQEEMMRAQEKQMKKMHENMRHQEEEMAFKMKEQESHMKSLERKMKSFEKELTEQLTKDGYLGKDDRINSIDWEKDGSIKINGKKIKETDQQKYKDLHHKYFKEGAHVGLAE